jgi:hypothetical protein
MKLSEGKSQNWKKSSSIRGQLVDEIQQSSTGWKHNKTQNDPSSEVKKQKDYEEAEVKTRHCLETETQGS